MTTSLLTAPESKAALIDFRRTGIILKEQLSRLPVDDQAYLEAEIAVRRASYIGLEDRLPNASEWVRKLCICYRNLFTDPKTALLLVSELSVDCPDSFDLKARLEYWKAHLLLMTGKISAGDSLMSQIRESMKPESFWKTESLAIIALGHFLAGRSKQALDAHYECQKALDLNGDFFIQTFNSAMATRVALKRVDSEAFEFFSKKLESSLAQGEDSRYLLRHAGYRALILNQVGEHGAADRHWAIGDDLLIQTESALERGQYLLYKGLSLSVRGLLESANTCYAAASNQLKQAGSPPAYCAELQVAQVLSPIASPFYRSENLRQSFEIATQASLELEALSRSEPGETARIYEEASYFCHMLLDGTLKSNECDFHSMVLSIIRNVSRSGAFASGISHFRMIPNFIEAIRITGISANGLSDAIHRVLRIRPKFDGDRFTLPPELKAIADSPDVVIVLDFAAQMNELSRKADQLFSQEAGVREAERATHLLHDLRFFSAEFDRMVRKGTNPIELSKVSAHFSELVEGHLAAIRTGFSPESPRIVCIDKLLAKVSQVAQEMLGRSVSISGDPRTFLWTSEPLLYRVLLNLTKNAIEASPEGLDPSLSIRLLDHAIEFHIQDHGQGVPEPIKSAIDSRFQSVVASSKPGGHGIGLRSAYQCARSIGASIELVASGPKGSHFVVHVSFPEHHIPPSASILVVDDSTAVREAWLAFATESKHQVAAVSPQEAVASLNKLSPKVRWVVLDYDLKLPNCTGADLAESIKKLGVKVALSSGYQAGELPADARAVCWDAILTKEPQIPQANKRIHGVQSDIEGKRGPRALNTLRHDLKNELTPMRTVHGFLKTNAALGVDSKAQRYVSLFGRSLEAIDRLLENADQDVREY